MIQSLRLQNFRTYKDETYEFSSGISIIVGPNASGKTNLLEAILVFAQGSSFRARDYDLLAYEAPWARLSGETETEQRAVVIEKNEAQTTRKRYEINTQKLSRLPQNRALPVVVFEPQHLQLLHSGPEKRRDFFDELLERTVVGYGKSLRDYKRALAQRNKLLKQPRHVSNAEYFVWEVRLGELGGHIAQKRREIIETCNQYIDDIYFRLSGNNESVKLEYLSAINIQNYSTQLLRNLEENRARDKERGFTADGPHRDDVLVRLKAKDARISASRGEIRTLLLALKLLELQIIEESKEHKPILLLDDVFSELDGSRRQALTQFLSPYQTFITTTDADVVVQHFIGSCDIIPTSK